ncbi:hypothetical protein IQ272_04200 [Chroococcidiopsidales cyanobacterium LEGE 13417]|nr:hypothetical protein [Chroococcidiopsidales cyanobacterium LEGE 13417]
MYRSGRTTVRPYRNITQGARRLCAPTETLPRAHDDCAPLQKHYPGRTAMRPYRNITQSARRLCAPTETLPRAHDCAPLQNTWVFDSQIDYLYRGEY